MTSDELIQLQPTLPMIAGELEASGCHCEVTVTGAQRGFRNVRIFSGQYSLEPDFLYIITKENAGKSRSMSAHMSVERLFPGRPATFAARKNPPTRLWNSFWICSNAARIRGAGSISWYYQTLVWMSCKKRKIRISLQRQFLKCDKLKTPPVSYQGSPGTD